jgi:hypothetical protein
MKKVLISGLVAVLFGAATTGLEAKGDKCGPAACAQVPCGPTYVEQKVTAYRFEYKTRKVERVIHKMHTHVVEEPCTWTEYLREVTPVTEKVTCWVPLYRDVPVKVRVCEWYTEPQKVVVRKCRRVLVEVPVKHRVCEQVVTPVKRSVTTYRCEPKEVVENVQVCRMVASCVASGCGCRTVCSPVYETVQVRRTVMNYVPMHQEVVVNEVSFRWVEKDGVRRCYQSVPYEEEVIVQARKHRWVERDSMKRVCDMVQQTRDVTRYHVTCTPVVKSEMRKRVVCEWRPETVLADEMYCVSIPYETVVKVPVYSCASSDCGPKHGCGFFGRFCGCK